MTHLPKDQQELEDVIDRAVDRAFVRFGFQADDPVEMQHDMAHLRRWRKAVERTTSTGFLAAVGIIVSGFLAAAWMGIKIMVGKSD